MDDMLMMHLHKMLALRNSEPHRASEIDAEIWQQLGSEGAILVIDMSGFTRTTKEFGILHFLAMHRQAMELCRPKISDWTGLTLKEDADNLIAILPKTSNAIHAAIQIQKDAAAYNQSVEYARQIGICIGISYGRILKTDQDVFGDPVNVAYKLGEDIADPWEILVSDAGYEELMRNNPEDFELLPRQEANTGKVVLGFHRVVFSL